MPLEPLAPGSPFPEISPTHTDVWVEFWNIVFQGWLNENLGGGSGESGWPVPFTMNGRIKEAEDDGLEPDVTGTPSLAIVLKAGSKWILDGKYYLLDDDTLISEITPSFVGWIIPVASYDETFETLTWSHTELTERPALGAGVACKISCLADRVNTIVATEAQADVIPTLPLILARLRVATLPPIVEGGSTTFLEDDRYTRTDPRPAITVIDEKLAANLAAARDLAEAGGDHSAPTEVDQLWDAMLGLVRGLRETVPSALRFVSVAGARPGLAGTASAPDTVLGDRGGTLPEVVKERNYGAS